MGEKDFSHTGIDLDVISISNLIEKNDGAPETFQEEIAADPEDYRVYLSGLLKRMQGRKAFLTFSQQVKNVNKILSMDYSSAKDIAKVILKDLGLTAQVLKLVNSPIYRHFAEKGIATISEAMIILGADEIRQLAAGLKIFEMMKSAANTKLLKDKIFRSLHRSAVAREMETDMDKDPSDAFPIAAMLYELGEYLVALLDPDMYIRVEITMEDNDLSREEAAKTLLGLSYSELGQMVALNLNLPKRIVHAMRPVSPTAPEPVSEKEEARFLCAFIYELCNIPEPENKTASFIAAENLMEKYQGIIDLDADQALWTSRTAMESVMRYAQILGIESEIKAPDENNHKTENKEKLTRGIQQVDDALAEGLSIHKIFTRLIDTMDQCFNFSQVVISIRKKETNTMEPRFIRGAKRMDGFNSAMGFKIEAAAGVFNNAISQKTDIIISNIKKQAFREQVPSWYLEKAAAPYQVKGFGIFPVFVDGKIVSMLYVDWDQEGSDPDEKTLTHIQGFRRQMIKAFTLHAR